MPLRLFTPAIKKLISPAPFNWTRIRIWQPTKEPLSYPTQDTLDVERKNIRTPKTFSFFAAILGGHVGHVSVETTKFYSSVYPDSADKTAIRTGKPTDLGFVASPQDDEIVLKEPNLTIDYFSLNTDVMAILFHQIKEGKIPYRAFQLLEKNGLNCSDLSFALLEEGGLRELLPFAAKVKLLPTNMAFLTPNMIRNILISAKEQEIKMFPETATMKIEQPEKSNDETSLFNPR